MRKMRYSLFVLLILICSAGSVSAQLSIGIGTPHVSIGVNLPLYPELVPVPGYPVYYAPRLQANYFFYDGMYWVFSDDNWYASSWYNGPWWLVDPEFVPLFVLRIPVRYYRSPPVYFRDWHSHAPPRWGDHWGHSWQERRRGWDHWQRSSVPSRAPLPVYQRRYTGDRYPRQVEQQRELRSGNYRYEPRTRVVREHFKEQRGGRVSGPSRVQQRGAREQEIQRQAPRRQGGQINRRPEPPRRVDERLQGPAPVQRPPQQRSPDVRRPERGAAPREQQAPRGEGRGQRSQQLRESPDSGRGRGAEQRGEGRGEGRGGGRE